MQTDASWRRVIVTIAMVLLPGCVALPRQAEQPVHTFLLSPDSVGMENGTVGAKPRVGVLIVSAPQAQPGFDSARMAYMQRPFEVQYYATNQWADPPARMVMPLLVQALEHRGIAHVVVALPTSLRGDMRLDVDQLMMVHEFLERPSRLRVGFRARVLTLPEQVVLGTRTFEAVEVTSTEDAYGGAVAANRAMSKLLDQVGTWTGICARGPSSACEEWRP